MCPPDTALPCSNFLKEMVSGSKLKCPSKVSWVSLTFSLLQCNLQQLFGKCTGRDEKCGKMWKNVKNVLVTRFAILLLYMPFSSTDS